MSEENDLEILLAKVSNPLNKDFDPMEFQQFCVLVEKDSDGPQTTLKFLAHKLQSPHEREALQALKVLEETVNRCGSRFHSEVGKFRFLNELIKIVSPKYLGNRVSPKLKEKTIELLYRWSLELKKEQKIFEAYQMLKRQGIVMMDPVHVIKNQPPLPTPPPRQGNDIIEDEEKSKLLQKLLQSRNPEDLQAANRLIKSMVRDTERKMELKERKSSEIEAVRNNATVLSDMLTSYRPSATSEEEKSLMKELYESCKRLRPQLFQLVSEMDDKDDNINELLLANDTLTNVIQLYQQVMDGIGTTLLDIDHSSTPPIAMALQEPSSSLLDEQLLALGLNDTSSSLPNMYNNDYADLNQIFSCSVSQEPLLPRPILATPPLAPKFPTGLSQESSKKGLEELDELGQSLLRQSLPSSFPRAEFPSTPQKIPLNQIHLQSCSAALATSGSPPKQATQYLESLFVSLESIKPGTIPPKTLYDQNGLTVTIHFGRDSPRPDVTVMVVTTINKSLEAVQNFCFNTAVPKSMKVKFQAPSATDLPAHNPILPPSAITQVLLLLNPSREKVRFKFKISYVQSGQPFTYTGDVDNLMA